MKNRWLGIAQRFLVGISFLETVLAVLFLVSEISVLLSKEVLLNCQGVTNPVSCLTRNELWKSTLSTPWPWIESPAIFLHMIFVAVGFLYLGLACNQRDSLNVSLRRLQKGATWFAAAYVPQFLYQLASYYVPDFPRGTDWSLLTSILAGITPLFAGSATLITAFVLLILGRFLKETYDLKEEVGTLEEDVKLTI